MVDHYERIVSERTESIAQAVVEMTFDTVDRKVTTTTDSISNIKADFSLFQTFMFLNDPMTASLEMIS